MGYQFIETELKDGLGTITLNRPPANVLNIAMMEELGKCFSAGVDVGEHMGDLAPKMIEDFHRIFRLMDKLGTLTIASVYGNCLGGGCELAIYCDLVVADESAKFGQPGIPTHCCPAHAPYHGAQSCHGFDLVRQDYLG
jgi:cyclohexa-1,5-dienecarbonyl-CoA hydratase